MFTGFLYFDIPSEYINVFGNSLSGPLLQSDLGLHRKGMAYIMHFVFQFMILESNTTLLKATGWGKSGKDVELNTKKNQDCVTL